MMLLRNLGLAAVFAGVLGSQNLVPDGGFENGAFPYVCNSQGVMISTWFGSGADTWTSDCSQKPALTFAPWGHFVTVGVAHGGYRFAAGWGQYNEAIGTQLSAPLTPGATYTVGAAFTKSQSIASAPGYDVWLSPNQTISGTQLGTFGTNAVVGSWTCSSFQFVAPAQPGMFLILDPILGYTGVDDVFLIPGSAPLYQVNQPGLATATINGVQGTAYCPALAVSSFPSGPAFTISFDAGAYDVAYALGDAFAAFGPPAIPLPDGQLFNLNLATVSWLCPGGPTPCLSGPLTLTVPPPLAGVSITAQAVAFGVGPLSVKLSQPFTLKVKP